MRSFSFSWKRIEFLGISLHEKKLYGEVKNWWVGVFGFYVSKEIGIIKIRGGPSQDF